MNEKLNQYRQLIYIGLILSILLCLGAYFMFVFPLQEDVQSKSSERDELEVKLQQLEDELNQEGHASDAAFLEDVSAAVPIWPEIAQIIQDLEQKENTFELTMESVTFSTVGQDLERMIASAEGEGSPSLRAETFENLDPALLVVGEKEKIETAINETTSTISIEVRFTAWEDQFDAFLVAVRELPRIYRVDSFQFRYDEENDRMRVVGTLRLSAFYAQQFHSLMSE